MISEKLEPDTDVCIKNLVRRPRAHDYECNSDMIFFTYNNMDNKDTVVICHIYPSNVLKKERSIYVVIP